MRTIIALLALLFFSVPFSATAQAQSCDTLAEADCVLWRALWERLDALQTAAVHVDMELISENILGQADMRLRFVGDGVYQLDISGILGQLFEGDAAFPAAQLETALNSSSVDMYVRLEVPPDVLPLPVRLPDLSAFDLRLVDGVLYLNLDKIAGFDTSGRIQNGWHGVALSGLGDALAALPVDTPLSYTLDIMRRLPLSLSRLPDVAEGDEALAQFQLLFDGESALATAEARDTAAAWLLTVMQAHDLDRHFSEDELEALAALYVDVLDDLRIEATLTLNRDTAHLRGLALAVEWKPQTETLLALLQAGDPLGVTSVGLNFTFTLDIALRDGDAVFRAPSATKIISLDDLLSAFDRP
ncbi:MAG: hypothetical protein D6712_14070 [Chloroflexi bacterium]|nr:MAG: hypothetical protein D6712_14070 [Chloroflexota bacterium]